MQIENHYIIVIINTASSTVLSLVEYKIFQCKHGGGGVGGTQPAATV